jgi:hypothetical protein
MQKNCKSGVTGKSQDVLFIHKQRRYYNIAASTFLLCSVICFILFLAHSLMVERILFRLANVRTAKQFTEIYQASSTQLSNENLAEAASRCSVEAFNRKDYAECIKFLKIIIHSNAHIEYRASAVFEAINICLAMNQKNEALKFSDILIQTPGIPREIRIKCQRIKQQITER